MKRISLNFFFLLLVSLLHAQTQMTIQGQISKISDGSPVADWLVLAFGGNPNDSTVFIYGTGITDAAGSYSIVVDVPSGVTELHVTTFDDCANNPQYIEQVVPVTPAGASNVNFEICADQPPPAPCDAWFSYYQDQNLTVEFIPEFYSIDGAAPATYSWDFGDGATSTEANPIHTFPAEGEYLVTLTITSESGCTATYAQQVFLFELPPFDQCWAWVEALPTADSLTFNFNSYYYGFDSVTAASYLWDFGDGTTSTEANPTHVYAQEGFYLIQLTVTGTDGCVATAQFPFFTDIPPLPECQAYINYTQNGTNQFDFESFVYNINGDSIGVLSYSWDFGDGNTSNEANPSHTYANDGVFTVQLSVLTEDSCEAYFCVVVFTYDCWVDTFSYGCQAMFSAGYGFWDPNGAPGSGDPLTINFYDMSLGAVQAWAWDFGDGATSTEQNPVHTYAAEGFYTVTLDITTLDGCQSTAIYDIYVGDDFPWTPEPDCQALFIPLPDSVNGNGDGIQFIDLSFSPNPIQSWTWDFGDGSSSTEQNPFHVYAQPGVYTISLEIEADSCNSLISFEIDTQNPWDFNREPAQLGLAGSLSGTADPKAFDRIKLFPNPAQEEVNIRFTATRAGDYELRVTDLSGKVLSRTQQQALAGENLARTSVAQLVPGLYLAELRTSDSVQTIRFVKN